MTPPTSPNVPLPTQNAVDEAEPIVPGDSTDGVSTETSSDGEEVPDSPLPQAAAEELDDTTADGEEEDEDYKIVLRDSLRDEEEREARAAAFEENKKHNESVDDWLKALSGVEETPPLKESGARGKDKIEVFNMDIGGTQVKAEPGVQTQTEDAIIDISDGEESTKKESGSANARKGKFEEEVVVITISD